MPKRDPLDTPMPEADRIAREYPHAIDNRPHGQRHAPAKAHTLRPGRVYLCIGPNCWGKAFTVEDAEKAARENYSPSLGGPWKFLMFDAPPDVYVDGMGSTVYTPALYAQLERLDQPEKRTDTETEQPATFQPIGDRPREIYRWGTK